MLASPISRLAAITVVALLGLTGAAAAADDIAYTKSSANLREGPGTTYGVIATLPKNTEVVVEACTATWCAVTADDGDLEGFLSKALLKKNKSGPDLPFNIQIILTPSGPFLNFGINTPEPPPKPKPKTAEVCFYQQQNFKGANFCVEPGDSDDDIPGSFDNNIESIMVDEGAYVQVCTGADMQGTCDVFDHSTKKLPLSLRNRITSYEVSDDPDDFDAGPDDDDEDDDGLNGNIIILQ